jgi:hypothetical protein
VFHIDTLAARTTRAGPKTGQRSLGRIAVRWLRKWLLGGQDSIAHLVPVYADRPYGQSGHIHRRRDSHLVPNPLLLDGVILRNGLVSTRGSFMGDNFANTRHLYSYIRSKSHKLRIHKLLYKIFAICIPLGLVLLLEAKAAVALTEQAVVNFRLWRGIEFIVLSELTTG